jgi:hypothetical protein
MAESAGRDKKESRSWLATIKRLIGILFGILVVAFLIAVFLFGDLLRTGGS